MIGSVHPLNLHRRRDPQRYPLPQAQTIAEMAKTEVGDIILPGEVAYIVTHYADFSKEDMIPFSKVPKRWFDGDSFCMAVGCRIKP